MRYSLFCAAFAATLLSWPVYAAEKTVVLGIKNANCVLCPPIVRQSLQRVSGVKTVKIDQANQMADFMATITFDDAIANVSKLIAATTTAGFQARVADTN
jgi:periplasmic mercuric ion binding protein